MVFIMMVNDGQYWLNIDQWLMMVFIVFNAN
jgi:hypothetical protein